MRMVAFSNNNNERMELFCKSKFVNIEEKIDEIKTKIQ